MAILPLIEISSLWVGDVPISPTRADFIDEAGSPVNINGYAGWTATMFGPAGDTLGELTGTEQGDHLLFTWPIVSILTAPGPHLIVISFNDPLGVLVQCEPFTFIVQAVDGWLSLEMTRTQWADAPLDDVFLAQLLDAAKLQCLTYAPTLPTGSRIPVNYLHAQLMQARALYQSVIANQQDNVGIEGFQVRVFPLDFTIRALLRPKRAIGGMF